MADGQEFYLPGGDGKWESPTPPDTLEAAQDMIRVLQEALGYYSDARSYDPESQDNEYPAHDELLDDKGLRARIGRLASTPEEFSDWLNWALTQERRF